MAYLKAITWACKDTVSLHGGFVCQLNRSHSGHAINIVTVENGDRYVFDVAFGGDCPTHPMLLSENCPTTNLGSQEVRLVKEEIEPSQSRQKVLKYQFRNSVDQEWNTFYCFSEVEFFLADFEIMNHFTSTSPASFHCTGIFVVKFLLEDGQIAGKMTLANDTVKQNMGGKSTVIKVCKDEKDRVDTLLEIFGIRLLEDEISAIHGRITELKSS
jgi:arylamine N-acetyltransferase